MEGSKAFRSRNPSGHVFRVERRRGAVHNLVNTNRPKSKVSGENIMLKHCLLALLLAAVVYTVASSAIAQDNGSNDQQSAPAGAPPEHGRGGHFDPAKRTEMLTKQL